MRGELGWSVIKHVVDLSNKTNYPSLGRKIELGWAGRKNGHDRVTAVTHSPSVVENYPLIDLEEVVQTSVTLGAGAYGVHMELLLGSSQS